MKHFFNLFRPKSSLTKKLPSSFCPLPFLHLCSYTDGRGRVCCNDEEFLKENMKETDSLNSYFNSTDYRNIRKNMLQGKRPLNCKVCFEKEDRGEESMRQGYINSYPLPFLRDLIRKTNADGVIKPEIKSIDIALGNTCNLKCRMCNPFSSSALKKEWDKIMKNDKTSGVDFDYDKYWVKKCKNEKITEKNKIFKLIEECLPNLKVLNIIGGEPLLIKEHYKILEMIIEKNKAKQITLMYNSNYTVIPKNIEEYWKPFKKVLFKCSTDAYGKLNEYIRYPSKWAIQEKNLHLLDQMSCKNKSLEISFHTTFMALNVFGIPELLDYLVHADFKKIIRFPCFYQLQTPEYLHSSVFPKEFKIKWADKILNSLETYENFFLDYNQAHRNDNKRNMKILRDICHSFKTDNSQEHLFNRFIKNTKSYDLLRKQSFLDIFTNGSFEFDVLNKAFMNPVTQQKII